MSFFSITSTTALHSTDNEFIDDNGSSTDGSISLLGDHELMHDEPCASTSLQPSQFWMQCHQPDLYLTQRSTRDQLNVAEVKSEADATIAERDGVVGAMDLFENINNRIAQSYLFNVALLILTGCSFAIFAVLYARYITPIYNAGQLRERIRALELQNNQLSMQLMQCQMPTEPTPSKSEFEIVPESDEYEVKQSELKQNAKHDGKVVWTGDGNTPNMKIINKNSQNDKEIESDENQREKSNHFRPKKTIRRTQTKEKSTIPNIPRNNFQFSEQFIDPNKFESDRNDIHKEQPLYDDYDFDNDFILKSQRKSMLRYNENEIIKIEDVLQQMEEHLEKVTQNCYLKYKQLKDDNVLDPEIFQKAQKKLLKLKKHFQRDVKRDRRDKNQRKHDNNDDDDDEQHHHSDSNENDKRKNERKMQINGKNNNRKEAKRFYDKEQNKTMKMYDNKKTALKSYDERRL